MREIPVVVTHHVRFEGPCCVEGLPGEGCDFCNWSEESGCQCCTKYADGPEDACPELVPDENDVKPKGERLDVALEDGHLFDPEWTDEEDFVDMCENRFGMSADEAAEAWEKLQGGDG